MAPQSDNHPTPADPTPADHTPDQAPDNGSPDSQTTFAEMREMVREFVAERDWRQFHSPKNLSMSVAIEAAELMEHFQWLTIDESRDFDAEQIAAAGEEVADVLCYTLALANELGLDLSQTLRAKMRKNRIKYPV